MIIIILAARWSLFILNIIPFLIGNLMHWWYVSGTSVIKWIYGTIMNALSDSGVPVIEFFFRVCSLLLRTTFNLITLRILVNVPLKTVKDLDYSFRSFRSIFILGSVSLKISFTKQQVSNKTRVTSQFLICSLTAKILLSCVSMLVVSSSEKVTCI